VRLVVVDDATVTDGDDEEFGLLKLADDAVVAQTIANSAAPRCGFAGLRHRRWPANHRRLSVRENTRKRRAIDSS
jgi:hypothetical protein